MNTWKQGHCATLDDGENSRSWFFHRCGFRCCVSFMSWRWLELWQLSMTTNLDFLSNDRVQSKKSIKNLLQFSIKSNVFLAQLTRIRNGIDPHAFGALFLAFLAFFLALFTWRLRFISCSYNDTTWIWILCAFVLSQHCKCFG